jgi:hypothetical protein
MKPQSACWAWAVINESKKAESHRCFESIFFISDFAGSDSDDYMR